MLRALLLSLALLSITGEAFALTVSWTCNPEPDMKEYRVESSKDAGKSWGIEATWPHPKPCTSPVSMGITRYMVPGERLFRLFAIDTAGNVARQPSEPASYAVKPSPIGNPGGQEEAALPPSPYVPPIDPPPAPPPVVPLPMPPPVVQPGDLTGLRAVDVSSTSGMLEFEAVAGSGADIRRSIAPIKWGQASSLSCTVDGDCPMANLLPDTVYQAQGVRYFGVMNQGATYGPLSPVVEFRTPPIVVPTPAVPPPPAVVTLQQAIQGGLNLCLTKKLAHTACMRALSEAVGKVNP